MATKTCLRGSKRGAEPRDAVQGTTVPSLNAAMGRSYYKAAALNLRIRGSALRLERAVRVP